MLADYYNYNINDFVQLYSSLCSPPRATSQTFKSSLIRIEKIYESKLEKLNLKFINNPLEVISLLKEQNYSENTIYSTISTIGKIIRLVDAPLNIINKIRDILSKLRNSNKEEEIKQQKTLKEKINWISYSQMISKCNEILPEMLEFKNAYEFRAYMFLNLFLRQPPVRLGNYLNCLIMFNLTEEMINILPNINNYLLINKTQQAEQSDKQTSEAVSSQQSSYTFIFNNYKTSKHYGQKRQKITDETMIKILDKYIFYFNRESKNNKYFLDNGKSKSMSQTNASKLLLTITEKLFKKSFSCDLLRHIYITEFLNENPQLKTKIEIASQMDHSFFQQNLYQKF